MTIEQLHQDMYSAMKANDAIRKSVLSSVIGAVRNAAIAEKCRDNISEELVSKVLLKEKKTLQEQIDTCPAERNDLMNEFKLRMVIMEEYAPKLLDNPVEIKEIMIRELAAAGIEPVKTNKGAAMKLLAPQFKGKADMKIVNQVISEVLI